MVVLKRVVGKRLLVWRVKAQLDSQSNTNLGGAIQKEKIAGVTVESLQVVLRFLEPEFRLEVRIIK
jgi:hypothetical protein